MPCIFCTLISTKSSCAKVKSVHKQCQNQYHIIETHFIHCEEFSFQHSFENNDFSLGCLYKLFYKHWKSWEKSRSSRVELNRSRWGSNSEVNTVNGWWSIASATGQQPERVVGHFCSKWTWEYFMASKKSNYGAWNQTWLPTFFP